MMKYMCLAFCALLVGCVSSPNGQTSFNVQATVLALDKAAVETLIRKEPATPAAILRLWKDGKGNLLTVCNAVAFPKGQGKVTDIKTLLLYRGERFSGVKGASVPSYEQRDVGAELSVEATTATDVTPWVTVTMKCEYACDPTDESKFSRVATATFTADVQMPFGQPVLIGGGVESPDGKSLIYCIGQADR